MCMHLYMCVYFYVQYVCECERVCECSLFLDCCHPLRGLFRLPTVQSSVSNHGGVDDSLSALWCAPSHCFRLCISLRISKGTDKQGARGEQNRIEERDENVFLSPSHHAQRITVRWGDFGVEEEGNRWRMGGQSWGGWRTGYKDCLL